MRILGTSPDTIDLAEDRDRFRKIMQALGIPSPSRAWPAAGPRHARSPHGSATRSWCAPPTCSAAGAWRSSMTTSMLERYLNARRGDLARAAGADRQVSRQRHRSRGRRHRRRQRRLRAGGHGAHRACRHPFRGFGLRHPADQSSPRSTSTPFGSTPAASPSSSRWSG